MIDKQPIISSPQPPTNHDRGFEHIVDVFRDGLKDWQTALIRRQQEFETNGITPRQEELVRERVGEDHADVVIQELLTLAMGNICRRATEESNSLLSAGLQTNTALFNEYRELAGNLDRLGEYITWINRLVVQGMHKAITHSYEVSLGTDMPEERQFQIFTKGLSFELGGCFELGDQSHQDSIVRILKQLKSGLQYTEFTHTLPNVNDKFTITPLPAPDNSDMPRNSGVPHLLVTIDRPVADLNNENGDVIHVTQRSEKVVIYPKLPEKLRRPIDKFLSLIPTDQELANFDQSQPNIVKFSSEVIAKMIGRYALLDCDSPGVVPVSSVVYARSIHNRNIG